jgi:hypothetical protein
VSPVVERGLCLWFCVGGGGLWFRVWVWVGFIEGGPLVLRFTLVDTGIGFAIFVTAGADADG